MEWTESLKRAVGYMETHLLEDIDVGEVAASVYMSPFYFQKGFSIMTGYSVGEYIRQRRLYLAALEVVAGQQKIIDLAYKYGYQTPESFTKAFSRFHGISPIQMKGDTTKIKVFLPLKITVTIQGGNDMDYTVEKMDTMQMIGFDKAIQFDSGYQEIPVFWSEFCTRCSSGKNPEDVQNAIENCMIGEFGICIDDQPGSKQFRYMIAGKYDGGAVPEGMKLFTLPAETWAKFQCYGPMPGALQTVNTKIFNEWLPGNPDYEVATGINIEWYSMGDMSAPDYESAVWIPVKRK
jgi:AraC family transcriptional regulator